MNTATPLPMQGRWWAASSLVVAGLIFLGGCGSLLPKPPGQPALFLLDSAPEALADSPSRSSVAATMTLVVNEARAASGYGTRQIAYVRTPNQLEYFAFNEWVEPPALMLSPLLARAIERTGAFRAVVRAPTSAAGDVRLETELVRLQHEFGTKPSRVRLTLRAVLVDTTTRRELSSREFEAGADAATDDPAGGVAAANIAARRIAADVAAFCAEWGTVRKK